MLTALWQELVATIAVAVLGISGGYLYRDGLANLVDWLLWWNNRRQRVLKRIIAEHLIHFDPPKEIGYIKKMRVSEFVDLFTPMNRPRYQRTVVGILMGLAKREGIGRPSAVAVSKLGNVPLATAVSRRYRVPLVVVRHPEPYHGLRLWDTHACDGRMPTTGNVLLVDDIAADGGLLLSCVQSIRAMNGPEVKNALVLVHRTDGTDESAKEMLRKSGVTLFEAIGMDDGTIAALARE